MLTLKLEEIEDKSKLIAIVNKISSKFEIIIERYKAIIGHDNLAYLLCFGSIILYFFQTLFIRLNSHIDSSIIYLVRGIACTCFSYLSLKSTNTPFYFKSPKVNRAVIIRICIGALTNLVFYSLVNKL
jgi:hypothetical protein